MREFTGFAPETLAFFRELEANNDRDWFADNRATYDTHVLEPSRAFVDEMGLRIRSFSPQIKAVPKVNKSLFRINRDTRFSADKSPYKTNMGIWFWEGSGKRMECSGFYFHLEPGMLMLGAGMYQFSKDLLKSYRAAVLADESGEALEEIARQIEAHGVYNLGMKRKKRVPRGFDKNHPRAQWLLYDGLTIGREYKTIPSELHSEDLLEFCAAHYRDMHPLHHWLCTYVVKAHEEP